MADSNLTTDAEFAENLSFLNAVFAQGFLLGNRREQILAVVEARQDAIVIVTPFSVFRMRRTSPPLNFLVEKLADL